MKLSTVIQIFVPTSSFKRHIYISHPKILSSAFEWTDRKNSNEIDIKEQNSKKRIQIGKKCKKSSFFYKKPRTDRSKETIAEKFFIKNQCFGKNNFDVILLNPPINVI